MTGSKSAQTFGQTLWMCLWCCFWMRLVFEFIDWVKQICSVRWVDPIQSTGDLNRTKMLNKKELFLLDWLSWTLFFQPLYLNWSISFCVLRLPIFRLELTLLTLLVLGPSYLDPDCSYTICLPAGFLVC